MSQSNMAGVHYVPFGPGASTVLHFGSIWVSIWVSFRFGTGFVPFEVMPERSWESFSFVMMPWFLYNNRVRAQVHVSAAALCIKTCMLPYSPKTRRTDFVASSWSPCVSMILHDSYIIYTQYILNIFKLYIFVILWLGCSPRGRVGIAESCSALQLAESWRSWEDLEEPCRHILISQA
jgi:hypothetical protein